MRIKENKNIKETGKKIFKIIKMILFIAMLILTYFVSEKVVDYLLILDVEVLKRSLNIILVVIVVFIYRKK